MALEVLCSLEECSEISNPSRIYSINGRILKEVSTEKDLGVKIDEELNFDGHIASKTKKSNSILGLIKNTFSNLTGNIVVILYKSLVRRHLEYCNQIWFPRYERQKTQIENIQHRATRLIPTLRNLSYEERLEILKLPTLEVRRRGVLIKICKPRNFLYDKEASNGLIMLSLKSPWV